MVHMSYAQWACLPSTYRNKVNPGSKAAQQGVREGDLISSINGRSTRDLTNAEAHALLRSAGDHLKLGLNQENGSPKRRIYKSSLQENTSIETIKKTTTKTTTTNTQIISTETKKNGTDDAKNEPNYENQNGNLKTNSTNQQDDTDKKYGKSNNTDSSSADYLDYATDSESTNCLGIRMPCGSRSRRNRRNRQRKRFQRASTPPNDGSSQNHLSELIEEEPSNNIEEKSSLIDTEEKLSPIDTEEKPSYNGIEEKSLTKNDADNCEEQKESAEIETPNAETKIDGSTLTITTERLCPDELPYLENLSTARSRLMRRNNRCKIEKKVMNMDTQICEITTIRNAVPMEARLDHIVGVGIVESSLAANERSPIENGSLMVTISEPAEPVEPLSKDLNTKVENLPGAKTCMALAIPTKRFDFLEIHEMTDSDVEFDNSNQKPQQQGIIVEAESDVERDSGIDEKRKDESEDEGDDNMSWEMEKKLRNFIEGLKLPSSPTEAAVVASSASASATTTKLHESDDVHSGGRDVPRGTSKTARKRVAAATLGAYQSQMSQESNRCLDIIQEEGETKIVDDAVDEKHIRDFINEEIGKYCRERRDLGSVLREDRKSVEMKDDEEENTTRDFKDTSVVDGEKKVESEDGEVNENKTRLIDEYVDVKGNDDGKDVGDRKTNLNENVKDAKKPDIDKCKQLCDTNLKDEKSEKETVKPKQEEVDNTFAQCENVETFMNLVKSLKESVINEVKFEKLEKLYKVSKVENQTENKNNLEEKGVINKPASFHEVKDKKEEENIVKNIINEIKTEKTEKCNKISEVKNERKRENGVEEKCVINKTESSHESEKIIKQESVVKNETNNIKSEKIEQKSNESSHETTSTSSTENNPKNNTVQSQNDITPEKPIKSDKINVVEKEEQCKKIVDIASGESVSAKIEEKCKTSEPEVYLEPEHSSMKDAVNAKNIESSNEIDLGEVLIHTVSQSDISNEIAKTTNEIFINDDINDKNNDDKLSNGTLSSNNDTGYKSNEDTPNPVKDYFTNINAEKADNENDILDVNFIEEIIILEDDEEFLPLIITEIENTEINIPIKSSPNKKVSIPISETLEFIKEQDKQTSEERAVLIQKENNNTTITEDKSQTTEQPIRTSEERTIPIKQENITSDTIRSDTQAPPPPKRSTSLQQPNIPIEVPIYERPVFIEKIPPPPPVRQQNILFLHDSHYPPDFPLCSQQAPKFAIFHQRALNAFDLDEQIEMVEFVKTLLTVLSNHESTRQDVQNFLSRYDLEKLPPNIRHIIDDLMAPTPSLSSASTSSDGYADLCNDLYVEAAAAQSQADNKIGIGEAARRSREIAAANAGYYNEAPRHREKCSEFTHTLPPPTQVPQQVEGEEEEVPPRPIPPLVQIYESHRCETSTDTTTETVCEKSVITLETTTRPDRVTAAEDIKKSPELIVQPQVSYNAVSPTEFQGQQQQQPDSSSSTASFSTAKYNPDRSSVADISSVAETPPVEDSPNAKPGTKPNDDKSSSPCPKRKLLLLNGDEEERERAISKAESSESPQPTPYSPVDDHLYYVPLDDFSEANLSTNDRNCDNAAKFSDYSDGELPDSLKDLCVRKILSIPRGDQLISEISISKFNIFKSLNALQKSLNAKELNGLAPGHRPSKTVRINNNVEVYENHQDAKLEALYSKSKKLELEEMTRQKSSTWTGVPTLGNPKLLVCFSPAQQETLVKTTADNLLDLHKKFINRRGYHYDHDHSISPPKYFVDISPLEAPKFPEPPIRTAKSSNRLLNIIKENPILTKSQANGFIPNCTTPINERIKNPTSHDENQERLRATRLSDWLNLARQPDNPNPPPRQQLATSGDVLIERRQTKQQQQQQHECADKTRNWQQSPCGESYSCRRSNNNNKCASGSSPLRNTTPTLCCRSPIAFNSAIIDKSRSSPMENKRSPTAIGRGMSGGVVIDPWYVNPALIIEDKPEVPPKVKKIVTVDRECIDTRSIFDQGPATPRSKNVDSPEALKQVTTSEIMDNLKQLQAGMKDQMDKRRRYSLPQEYFDKQLKYIERLENQLKDVIVAEEEDRRAAEEFQREIEGKRNKSRAATAAESSFSGKPTHKVSFQQNGIAGMGKEDDDCITHKDQWKESSRKVEGDNSEYENKEGSRETKKEIKSEKGFYTETSSEKIEKREEHTIAKRSVVNRTDSQSQVSGSKLKDFLRDLNDPNLDKTTRTSRTNENHPHANDLEKQKQQQQQEEVKRRLKIDRPVSIAAIPTNGEVFRRQMYDEYVHKVLEREERKQHKVIKISSHTDLPARKQTTSNRGKRHEDYSSLNKVEQEFIEKAKNRLSKFGIKLDESETEGTSSDAATTAAANTKREPKQEKQENLEAKFLVDGREVKDARSLPKHLQEFLRLSTAKEDELEEKDEQEVENDEMIAPTFKASSAKPGVWSPGSESAKPLRQPSPERGKDGKDEAIPPVWTPSSAGPSPVPERKEFRPVPFESPVLSRKKFAQPQQQQQQQQQQPAAVVSAKGDTAPPPWKAEEQKKEASQVLSQSIPSRIVNSYSAPSQGLNALAAAAAPRLPRAQNPTITLLQKAREGQLPKGAAYLDEPDHIATGKHEEKPLLSPGEVIYTLKKEYESEPETENAPPKKMADLGPRKYEGIGPTTRGGVPIVLRSEVKENNQAKWYKQMYDSLHRAPKNDDYVTIRYKPHRGTRTGYSGASSGYLSEPEPRSYSERSATLDNRRHRQRNKENEFSTSTLPRPTGRIDGHYSPETYHLQPGRIEDYVPGNCSIQEKEAKESPAPSDLSWAKRKWWDEVMDIFDGWLDENGRLQSRRLSTEGLNNTQSTLLQRSPSARPALQSGFTHRQGDVRLSHSVSRPATTQATTSRSLRGPSPLGRLYSANNSSSGGSSGRRISRSQTIGKIRRDLELNDEQQRLRQSRLLESLFELTAAAGGGVGSGGGALRPRSGSTGERIIKPLGGRLEDDDWAYVLGPVDGLSGLRNRATIAQSQRCSAPVAQHQQQQQSQLLQHVGSSANLNMRQPVVASVVSAPMSGGPAQPTLSSSASSSSSVTNSSSNGTTTSTNHVAPFEQSSTHSPKSYMTHALKESGYESDSTLVFRRREDASPLSPLEQRIAYKTVQKGGDVPLHGLRKPAPERPKDDTEIEYFPISPTLTRIRVHRKSSCSSATASPASSTSSMNVSRIPVMSLATRRSQSLTTRNSNLPLLRKTAAASNAANSCSIGGKVPSPPKRKSSRNNRTLKLYTNSAKSPENAQNHSARHEQCFVEEQISNIRLLKEKLNANLERHRKDREELLKQRILRTSSASPVSITRRSISGGISGGSLDSRKRRSEPCLSRSPCGSGDLGLNRVKSRLSCSASPVSRAPKTPLLKKPTEVKPTISRAASKTSIGGSSRDLRNIDKVCQHTSRARTTNSALKKDHKVRRTKKEQEESCKRLSRPTADLTSPVEVRRVLQRQKEKERQPRIVTTKILPSGTVVKSSTAPLASSLGTSRLRLDDKSLKVTVAISPKGREILKKPAETGKTTLSSKQRSPATENTSDSKKRKARERNSPIPIRKSESKQSICDSRTKIRKETKESDTSQMKSRKKESSRDLRKTNSLERLKSSERMTRSEISTPTLTVDLLRQHHEATMSDSFFQHLFLRDILLTSSQTNPLRRSSVLDRVRMFQEISYSDSYKSEPSLKSLSIYLAHKRPVSNSRFRNWERESMSSRSSSPYGVRPSLSRFNKYDSLLRVDEFGSSSSLRGRSPDLTRECPKERSLSEPPLKTLRESPDSSGRRSPSPSPVRSPSVRKIQVLRQENSDNPSESSLRKSRARSASEMDYIYGYKQNFGSNTSLTRSTSSLMNFPIDREDYQQYILERLHSRQKSKRYKDLYDFYTSLERMGKLEKTTSTGDLRPRLRNEEIIDYERWKQVRTKEKAEQELQHLYKKLKLAQREKDFLFSTRDVDRSKWRGDSSLRCKERSVENIREQFRKLENEESELEALRQREIASKKDTYKPLWRGNSVVNVANTISRKAAERAEFDRSSVQASLQKSLGGSNKFWSSLSIEQVTALKNQLNDIYGNDPVHPKKIIKPKCPDQPSNTLTVPVLNGTLESRKEHLAEITAHSKRRKDNIISDSEQSSISVSEYEIVVPKKKRDNSPDDNLGLHVRCHSMIAADRSRRGDETDTMKRSGSISRVSSLERSQSDRVPNSSPMSEGEKKRLSLTLGKEMLEKVSQRLTSSMVKPRETRGALAAAMAKSTSSISPRTCSSIDAPTSDDTSKSKERSDFVLVLTPSEDGPEQKERIEKVMKEWSKKPPTLTITTPEGTDQIDSATESSDTSVKTVVRRSSECEDLLKKVEFYEEIDERKEQQVPRSPKTPCKLSSSQSFADLKELFGESAAAKYRTIPLYRPRSRSASPAGKAEQIAPADCNGRGRSSSASPDVVASTRRPVGRSCLGSRDHHRRDEQRSRSVSPYRVASPATDYFDSASGSLESLWQRCGSPDPEKYWRTYLKLVRDGQVRRLRAKFESLEELSHCSRRRLALAPKRFQSDPELARNLLKKVTDTTKNYIKPQEIPDVAWLRRKYEPPRGRRRRGGTSPIPRVPWRLEDLTMPHINVISKTAELKDSASRKPANSIAHKEETKELEARRAVNRVREMFERSISPDYKTSILGEMFTSAPNVHELRDIAPYLAGRWVAHQYPSRYDNSRSLSSPPDLSRESETSSQRSKRSITPPSRKKRFSSSRASSASPVRPRTPVSILKQSQPNDVFANQPFDPSKHRPRFRYQPPPPPLPLLPPSSTLSSSPKVRYRSKTWCPPIPTYNARPTVVTFEGPAQRSLQARNCV